MSKKDEKYAATLNLPETEFPMRAGLPKREPDFLDFWYKNDIYGEKQKLHAGHKKFVLHDGPPYANGKIHMGHALNKVLKDIILKEKTLEGFQAPYVPGWDCHGMPIEVQIEKLHGKNLPVDKTQSLARAYATEQIDLQRADFKRLGVLGYWDNPYRTMRFDTEANEIRALKHIMEKGYVYRGLKPVNWCFDCQSALAEAEVEYKDKTSPTIDVAFELAEDQKERVESIFGVKLEKPCFTVIWTTTPWTIPSNQALNVNPELNYVLVDTGAKLLILGEGLYEDALKRYELTGTVLATVKGEALDGLEFLHPLYHMHEGYRRRSPVYLADYVDATAGTGIVHSAPAYGVDDFVSCKNHGLKNDDIISPVQGDGVFADWLPLFGGLNIWKAAEPIMNALTVAGNLLAHGKLTHSYMHCWRHKTPLIYRATSQWFVRMDGPDADTKSVLGLPAQEHTLREEALAGVKATKFFPQWGINRLYSMIENRPDWCISRQRHWGVPLPFFMHKATGELHPKTLEIMDRVAELVEKGGIEAWAKATAEDFLGAEAADYVKTTDILDVWFDSGSTHYTVMRGSHADILGFPADLYLEGSDQHRGWFHSSLLISTMLDGVPPYKQLLTHGFVVDEKGEKMSKSKGNIVRPQEVIEKYGADILRLWVASTDYSGELRYGETIVKHVIENYRRVRNTLRFLLANTSDLTEADLVPVDEMLELDRWAMAFTQKFQDAVMAEYKEYRFHNVVTLLQTYASTDLGCFYLDAPNDHLYTTGATSHARRSAQTALWHITKNFLRLIAPILSFTAEEGWAVFVKNDDTSVFFDTFEPLPEPKDAEALLAKWERIRAIRADAQVAIEEERTKGTVGSSLQAVGTIRATPADYELLASLGEELRFVMIMSAVELVKAEGDKTTIEVRASDAKKCERCWHYVADVGSVAEHPTLCPRCVSNLFGSGEKRLFA